MNSKIGSKARRNQQRNAFSNMSAIDAKIAVKRQQLAVVEQLRHPHQTSVCQRHWDIRITGHQIPHVGRILIKGKRQADNAAFEQSPYNIGPAKLSLCQETCFRQHGIAKEQWGFDRSKFRFNPIVMLVAHVQQRQQRSGIQQDQLVHSPKPSMYFGFVERSPGPSRQPARSPANSSADAELFVGIRPLINCSIALRTKTDLFIPRCLATRSNLACRLSGSFKEIVFMIHHF